MSAFARLIVGISHLGDLGVKVCLCYPAMKEKESKGKGKERKYLNINTLNISACELGIVYLTPAGQRCPQQPGRWKDLTCKIHFVKL